MKKIIIFILLIFTTLFISCSCNASDIDDFIIYDGILYKYVGSDEIVRIPETYYQNGKRMNVTEIESSAFDKNETIETIILPNTIKIIREFSFNDLNIKRIKLSKNIENISENTFYNCSQLQYLNYDNNNLSKYTNLKVIGNHAFRDTSVDNLILPEGLTSIGLNLFNEYYYKERFPDFYTEYGNLYYLGTKDNPYEYMINIKEGANEYYLHKDTKLMGIYPDKTKLHIEEGNEYYKIEDESLYQIKENRIVSVKRTDNEIIMCDEKAEILGKKVYSGYLDTKDTIIVPNNIKVIEQEVFFDVFLNKIVIGKGVEYIHPEAFNYCYISEGFEVDEENQYYKSVNGVIYTKDGKHLVRAPNRVVTEELTIEEGVEVIDSYAFWSCQYRVVNAPDTLTEIKDYAFQDNGKLTTFNQTTPLKIIGKLSFMGSAITKILLDDSIKSLEKGTFDLCYNLRIENLPTNLEFIGPWALYGIKEYSEEVLPLSLKYIMKNAISVDMPMNITIGKNVKYIDERGILFNSNFDIIKISEENNFYKIKDGVIVYKDKG